MTDIPQEDDAENESDDRKENFKVDWYGITSFVGNPPTKKACVSHRSQERDCFRGHEQLSDASPGEEIWI